MIVRHERGLKRIVHSNEENSLLRQDHSFEERVGNVKALKKAQKSTATVSGTVAIGSMTRMCIVESECKILFTTSHAILLL